GDLIALEQHRLVVEVDRRGGAGAGVGRTRASRQHHTQWELVTLPAGVGELVPQTETDPRPPLSGGRLADLQRPRRADGAVDVLVERAAEDSVELADDAVSPVEDLDDHVLVRAVVTPRVVQ